MEGSRDGWRRRGKGDTHTCMCTDMVSSGVEGEVTG